MNSEDNVSKRISIHGPEDSRAKNCLTIVSKGPEEGHDGPSTLRVESRSGLVKEEQEFRLQPRISGAKYSVNHEILP